MTLPDLLIDVCHPYLLMVTDGSVRPKPVPGKTDHQCLELLRIQLHLVAMPHLSHFPSCPSISLQPAVNTNIHLHLPHPAKFDRVPRDN